MCESYNVLWLFFFLQNCGLSLDLCFWGVSQGSTISALLREATVGSHPSTWGCVFSMLDDNFFASILADPGRLCRICPSTLRLREAECRRTGIDSTLLGLRVNGLSSSGSWRVSYFNWVLDGVALSWQAVVQWCQTWGLRAGCVMRWPHPPF